MRARYKEVAHGVFFRDLRAFNAESAAPLRLVLVERSALDIAVLRNRDDHRLLFDKVLVVDVDNLFLNNLGSPLIGKLLFNVEQIVANDRENIAFV